MKAPTGSKRPAILRTIWQKTACILLGLVAWTFASSQVIGNWAFSGILSGIPGLNNLVSVADFSSGSPTHSFNGGTEYFGEGGWPTGGLNSSVYFQFGLSPLLGFQLDITSVVLRIRRSNTGSPAGSGPVSWSLRSSLDGYTTDIATGSMTHNYANYTVTPGSAFLNLYTPVTFRLYGYNASVGSGGTSRLVIDNITASGISSVLPLTFKSFSVFPRDKKTIALQFSLLNTKVNNRYSIERSVDGNNFVVLNEIKETVTGEQQYNYTDDNLPPVATKLFYRVRVSNNAGQVMYSSIVPVVLQNTNRQSLRATIQDNQLHLAVVFATAGNTDVSIYSLAGKRLSHISCKTINGYQRLVLPIEFIPAGTYVVNVSNSTGQMSCLLVNRQ